MLSDQLHKYLNLKNCILKHLLFLLLNSIFLSDSSEPEIISKDTTSF